MVMPSNPLAEVFGYPPQNRSAEAERHQARRLCPFNNKVPNCTKDKANDPLGVCSIQHQGQAVITCPVRFRQVWQIVDDAAAFFFPNPNTSFTSLVEVRLNDVDGKSAGNIDIVLVSYDDAGRITDFGALEVQAVYISGNVRQPFEAFMAHRNDTGYSLDWSGRRLYPNPDYLSSSRKRLAPQLMYKGGILNAWRKKQAVAIQRSFYDTLPRFPQTAVDDAEMIWLLYDLHYDAEQEQYDLVLTERVYSLFEPAMETITKAKAGPVEDFIEILQERLDVRLSGAAPDAPTLSDIVSE
jgi:hypothetical protein